MKKITKRRAFLAGSASLLAVRHAQAGFDIFDVVSVAAPTVAVITSVTASPATGTFGSGQTILITVNFSQSVNVTGIPLVNLNTAPAETANYSSGSGSTALVFSYTVGATDSANPLATVSVNLNGGSISNGNGAANLSSVATTFTGLIISNAGLPTGLIQSTPLGGGLFTAQQQNSPSTTEANGDGTTGWSAGTGGTLAGWTILQIWWNCPASQYYTFQVPSWCSSFAGVPGNSLQVYIDQLQCPYDGGTTGNLNWFMAFVSNVAPSQNYNFTAPVTAGFHSIQVFMCNGAHNGSGALNNHTHCDRLNIIGTGTPLPTEPAGSRNPSLFPFSSYHFMNTPIGASATWLSLTSAVAETLNGNGAQWCIHRP